MENSDFSYHFRTLSNNLIQNLAKVVSASLPKMTSARPEEFFEENKFLKNFREVTCFWIWAKNLWQDGKTAFTCPMEQCWKVEPFGENQSFFVVSTHYVKLFLNFRRSWQGCQVSFHHLQTNILRKNSTEWNSFQFFPMLWLRAKKHWVELSHLLPRCRREFSEKKHNFELYSIFFQFGW